MYEINVPKLRGKMTEKNYTISSLANTLGIDRNTLAKYLSIPSKIPYDVMVKIAECVCDSRQEATDIFFCKPTYVKRKDKRTNRIGGERHDEP